ncbi:hypothetical protein GGF46_002821 [Coemansia sp. RSA 552]|nr:hypothetical protein GGF46_002821 [Coemansia sp. RSA 552]
MDSPPAWLVDYYCSVVDVVAPACGLAVAVSAAVLVAMYRDVADTIAVRVSGMLGLADALYHVCQLIVRELSRQPSQLDRQDSAAARVFAFIPYFLQLLNVFLANRIALDLQISFLGWFSCSRALRWILAHYVRAAAALALLLACPLLAAPAHFDPMFLHPQWSFGSTTRDTVFLVFSFYLWVLLLLLNFALVIVVVIARLSVEPPSQANPTSSLATHIMRSVEQNMRRKARILVLYPLSPIIFYSPSLVFYWVQILNLEHSSAVRAIWITSVIVGPLQSIYDFMVFVLLPPVRRVIRWHWVLHKDSDMVPLMERTRRESIFVGPPPNMALTSEEAWVQDIADPRLQ